MVSTLELARICNVSQGTVDRALHGRPGISAATRDRILKAAVQHGHRPHPAAREILTGKSAVVQAILPALNNIFFMDFADRLAALLAGRGLRLQITLVRDREALLSTLEEAAARRCRMAVVVPPEDGIPIPASLTRHLPVVALMSPCAGRNVPFVSPDEEATGAVGVDHLHARGHRRILFLTYPRRAYAIAARARGYRRRMEAFGLRPGIGVGLDGEVLFQRIKKEKITALFCHNDWMALRAILALRERGLAVPGDLSVLGIDDSPTLISVFPDLTTLIYPVEAILNGVAAVLDGKAPSLSKAVFSVAERGTVRSLSPLRKSR